MRKHCLAALAGVLALVQSSCVKTALEMGPGDRAESLGATVVAPCVVAAGPVPASEPGGLFGSSPAPNPVGREGTQSCYVLNWFKYPDGSFHVMPLLHQTELDAERWFREGEDLLVSGTWEGRAQVMGSARVQAQEALARAVGRFPAVPAAGKGPAPHFEGRWVLDPDAADNVILFRCPRPHEHYAGWVGKFDAAMGPDSTLAWADSALRVTVEAKGVTLGEAGIDETVAYSIEAESHPVCSATIYFEGRNAIPRYWQYPEGGISTAEFEMAGRKVRTSVAGDAAWIRGADGKPRLRLTGTFLIPLSDPFRITGVVGTPPANDVVKFFVRLTMKPAGG